MTDKETFYEFARGLTVGLGIFALSLLFMAMITPSNVETEKRFEVADKYGDCNVVRYTPLQRAESVYFLDCRKGG